MSRKALVVVLLIALMSLLAACGGGSMDAKSSWCGKITVMKCRVPNSSTRNSCRKAS